MIHDIEGSFKNLLPGNIDEWNRVYATVAAANLAIPDVTVGGKSFREGKVVQIGTSTVYEEYRWKGGFADVNLVRAVETATQIDTTDKPIQSQAVKVLKDDYRQKTIFDLFENVGFILSLTGVMSSDPLYRTTGFLPVLGDINATVYDGGTDDGVTSKVAPIAFYDSMGNFVSSYTTGSAGTKNITILKADIPARAYFYRISCRLSQFSDDFILNGFKKSETLSRDILKILNPAFIKSGFINKSTGLPGAGVTYRYTEYIPITIDDTVTVTAYNGGVVSPVVFYDGLLQRISALEIGTEGEQTITLNSSNIPATAKYFISTCRINKPASIVGVTLNSVLSSFKDITTNVVANANNIKQKTVFDLYEFNGFLLSLTGAQSSDNLFRTTGFLPILGDITVTGYDGGPDDGVTSVPAIVVFFDSVGNYISSYTSGTSGMKTVTILKANMPTRAYFYRTTCRATQLN